MLGLQCPQCKSSSVRLTSPTSADLMSFKCNDCGRSWSETLFRNRMSDDPTQNSPRPPRAKKRK